MKKNSFCCLGVAGELGYGTGETEVCETMGIAGFYKSKLIVLNDDAHCSFSKIADWAQKNILGVK